MKRTILCIVAGISAVAMGAGSAVAAEDEDVKEILAKLVDINAMVSTVYTYSFNDPASNRIGNRVIDQKENTIGLHDAWLAVSRMREDEDFGFMVNVDFGDAAEFTCSDWDGSGGCDGSTSEEDNSVELREAYMTYKMPVLDMTLKAGKFVTLLGYEVLRTNTDLNPNISHSMLFGFAIPFTHVGVLVNAPLGDSASIDIGIVNGWDNVEDNNDSKTLLAGFGLEPLDMLSMYIAGTYGSEQNQMSDGGVGSGSKRGVVTGNATLTLTEQLAFVLDVVYGNESDLIEHSVGGSADTPAFVRRGDAQWWGVGGYALLNFSDHLSFSLRAEVLDDMDGTRNFSGVPATLWEITPTIACRFNEHLVARIEYRHDEASKPIFEKDNGKMQSGSDTLAAELVVML